MTVGEDKKRRGEHADNEGDDVRGEYESGDDLEMPSGEYQSATRFGVSTNAPGENRSRAAIRAGVIADRAGECTDLIGVSLGFFDTNFDLADDDSGVAGEVGSTAEEVLRVAK
ncbi:hypothetical protein BGZ50_009237, partial [Haplosporangium sp. Z 11]